MTAVPIEHARLTRLEDEVRRLAVWAWGKDRAPAFLPITPVTLPPMEGSALGHRLRSARKAAGLKTATLANIVGLSEVAVRSHENGQRGANVEAVKAYADACGVRPEWLAWGLPA